jgi:hypothetical protein
VRQGSRVEAPRRMPPCLTGPLSRLAPTPAARAPNEGGQPTLTPARCSEPSSSRASAAEPMKKVSLKTANRPVEGGCREIVRGARWAVDGLTLRQAGAAVRRATCCFAPGSAVRVASAAICEQAQASLVFKENLNWIEDPRAYHSPYAWRANAPIAQSRPCSTASKYAAGRSSCCGTRHHGRRPSGGCGRTGSSEAPGRWLGRRGRAGRRGAALGHEHGANSSERRCPLRGAQNDGQGKQWVPRPGSPHLAGCAIAATCKRLGCRAVCPPLLGERRRRCGAGAPSPPPHRTQRGAPQSDGPRCPYDARFCIPPASSLH